MVDFETLSEGTICHCNFTHYCHFILESWEIKELPSPNGIKVQGSFSPFYIYRGRYKEYYIFEYGVVKILVSSKDIKRFVPSIFKTSYGTGYVQVDLKGVDGLFPVLKVGDCNVSYRGIYWQKSFGRFGIRKK